MTHYPSSIDDPAANPSLSDEPVGGPVLVAFDFDGTLTVRDSFTAFLRWRVGAARFWLRLIPPAIRYLAHRRRAILKAEAVKIFLKGMTREALETEAKAFAEFAAPNLFRPDALATWRRWQAKGARVVIVTASPDILVAPFARGLGAEVLIGTQLEFDQAGKITGALASQNCRGPEKVRRLRQTFGEDVTLAAAYGDTAGDHDMLRIADEQGYRVFTGKPD